MKTIHIEAFDKSSVDKAIEEVKAIKKEWKQKAKQAESLIAEELANLINENLMGVAIGDDLKDIKTHQQVISPPGVEARARGNTVTVYGENAVFIEFGAGIYYNGGGVNNPLSKAVQFDTSIGSYGKGQGNKKYWFVAHNLISCGTPAYMPINNAIEQIVPMIPTIVRQVFV